MFDVQKVWDVLINIMVASAGGVVRLLNAKDKRRLRGARVVIELLTSAFTGYMFLLLANEMKLSGNMTGLVCGMAGWVGPKFLDGLILKVEEVLGIRKLKEKKEEEEQNG